ncbi:hypothetical protein ABRY95_13935 [Castellaniella ginsengisoli]|uniref:Uncharacterized protein n=1 Tax=Castellaniella ginsengisoli TaxID=546114 RepID=A0AB39HBL5_9BURK
MSEATIILIGAVAFGAGYVVGHIHALLNHHKRRHLHVVPPSQDCRYGPKQHRRGRNG